MQKRSRSSIFPPIFLISHLHLLQFSTSPNLIDMKNSIIIPSTTEPNHNISTELLSIKHNGRSLPSSISCSRHKNPNQNTQSASINLRNFNIPLISSATGSPLDSICLEPDRLYTIGRSQTEPKCDFVFSDRRVSKQHCQILFDSLNRKIYVIDGVSSLLQNSVSSSCVVCEFRKMLVTSSDQMGSQEEDNSDNSECSRIRARFSMNGVFVNGRRVRRGYVRELCRGDEILFVCGNEGLCNLGVKIGFLIQDVVLKGEVAVKENEVQLESCLFGTMSTSIGRSQGSVSSGSRKKRVFAVRADEIMATACNFSRPKCGSIVKRAKFLLNHCRRILHSNDPISYLQQCYISDFRMEITKAHNCKMKFDKREALCDSSTGVHEQEVNKSALVFRQEAHHYEKSDVDQTVKINKEIGSSKCVSLGYDTLHGKDISKNDFDHSGVKNAFFPGDDQMKPQEGCCQPPGKKFYLNRLLFMEHDSLSHRNTVSLPELLHPTESIAQIFIATFTSDILWFLSHCGIPFHLPVTIACHNTERCWSPRTDDRISMPYSNYPNLVVVFPPFPEAIAFGNDHRRQGIACHHPKLFVLQREDSIRVIITSANLVPNQWNNVTNTVWWQDFPRRSTPDISSLFISVSDGISQDSRSDFATQLAGFMASLVIDIPSQAHWMIELTNYNFDRAVGYLVASVPGIHSRRTPACVFAMDSIDVKLLGSVEAFVVGLSHLFRMSADVNGALLKKLAAFLGRTHENAFGMSEIVLRRNTNVPADVNAVSVLVPNPDQFAEGDCVQLGFLPKNVAKWVSPLWDGGFFKFSGYIHPKEALAAASGGNNMRLQLMLHVSQGPRFSHLMTALQPEHVSAICSLIASIQRCTGLWRLQEVLDQYKWPEAEQSDFIYGSSSIGSSINVQFLSSFSAAAGKRSRRLFDSEESDPEWGCWTASQELRNPSIRIIFPTIERVRNACNGVLPSRRILCFSE
ncbi:uncharacterized protein LOC126675501 isoform X2 [Mercurialis annua]|nr:uncharacterized protein LOC126675501 isoform X2 [Mercurialis annua]